MFETSNQICHWDHAIGVSKILGWDYSSHHWVSLENHGGSSSHKLDDTGGYPAW